MESVVHFRQKLDNEMRAVNPHRVSGIFNCFWTLIIYRLCTYGFLGPAHDQSCPCHESAVQPRWSTTLHGV